MGYTVVGFFLIKYDGEDLDEFSYVWSLLRDCGEVSLLLDEVSSVWSLLVCCRFGCSHSELVCSYMCLWINVLV
jgi:hypothetical protein